MLWFFSVSDEVITSELKKKKRSWQNFLFLPHHYCSGCSQPEKHLVSQRSSLIIASCLCWAFDLKISMALPLEASPRNMAVGIFFPEEVKWKKNDVAGSWVSGKQWLMSLHKNVSAQDHANQRHMEPVRFFFCLFHSICLKCRSG